ncbi:MAG TPA: hypothetical protein VHT27_01510 [Solirubrobacteraceae bacterium]|jgi:hypothetical protein|nr:hypothetical protein [Solirubrobacteraceae bacterium]
MVINHHIAAALASERQRDLLDDGRRWRRAEPHEPVPAPVDASSAHESRRDAAPRRSTALDGRLSIMRAGDLRPRNARSRERERERVR